MQIMKPNTVTAVTVLQDWFSVYRMEIHIDCKYHAKILFKVTLMDFIRTLKD